jgi:hypothetical protein
VSLDDQAAMLCRLQMLELELENAISLVADGHVVAAESALRQSQAATQRVLDRVDDGTD